MFQENWTKSFQGVSKKVLMKFCSAIFLLHGYHRSYPSKRRDCFSLTSNFSWHLFLQDNIYFSFSFQEWLVFAVLTYSFHTNLRGVASKLYFSLLLLLLDSITIFFHYIQYLYNRKIHINKINSCQKQPPSCPVPRKQCNKLALQHLL